MIRNTGWNRAKTRREVRKAIRSYGLNPVGHAGYAELRRRLMNGDMLDHELQ